MLRFNITPAPKWIPENYLKDNIPPTWEKVFENSINELNDIYKTLEGDEKKFGSFFPLKEDLFNAFRLTALQDVKLVIVGQDPYHQAITVANKSVPRAMGLSFSVRKQDMIPYSLQNIYIELENTVKGFTRPQHGDLTDWAKQGVLLLNTCLTVRANSAGSHSEYELWLGFISNVCKAIAAANPTCIYMLWGKDAQKLRKRIGEKSVVLEAAHPSGLSAKRGFFGCNHFNMANDILIKQGKQGIKWSITNESSITPPVVVVETQLKPFTEQTLFDYKHEIITSKLTNTENISIKEENIKEENISIKEDVQFNKIPMIPNIKKYSDKSITTKKVVAVEEIIIEKKESIIPNLSSKKE